MKTRHQNDSLRERGDLADLFASSLVLIRADKRDETQKQRLRRALQLFIDDRLAGVISGTAGKGSENVQQLLSLQLSTVLSSRAARQMSKLGAEYVGELFLLEKKAWRNPSATASGQEVRGLINGWGIPLDLNLNEAGWVPPYASDPAVLAAWALRYHELIDPQYVCNEEGGCRSIGEALQLLSSYPLYWAWRKVEKITRLRELGLRQAMFVPHTWEPPARDPEACHRHGRVEWEGALIPYHLQQCFLAHGFDTLKAITAFTKREFAYQVGSAAVAEVESLMREHGLTFKDGHADQSVLSELVDDLVISVRTFYCLKNAGIRTIGQVASHTEAEYLRMPNFGRKSLNELIEVLAQKGVYLLRE